MDDRVAWARITIPERGAYSGETVDDWFPLSGRIGEEQKGTIDLVLTYTVGLISFLSPSSPICARFTFIIWH